MRSMLHNKFEIIIVGPNGEGIYVECFADILAKGLGEGWSTHMRTLD